MYRGIFFLRRASPANSPSLFQAKTHEPGGKHYASWRAMDGLPKDMAPMRDNHSSDHLLAALVPNGSHALVYLWEAYASALELAADPWNFACQLEALRAAGIADTVLRWFVAQGYAEHRLESTQHRDE